MKKSDYVRFGSLLLISGVSAFAQGVTGGGGEDSFSKIITWLANTAQADSLPLAILALIFFFATLIFGQTHGFSGLGRVILGVTGLLSAVSIANLIYAHAAV